MQVQDAPLAVVSAAHRHTVAGDMLFWRVNPIAVGIPEGVAVGLHVAKCHFVAEVGREFQKPLLQVAHDLLAAAKLSVRIIENNFGIETFFKLEGPASLEGERAVLHSRFHLAVKNFRVGGLCIERSNLALEVDGHAHFVEKIHTENAVNLTAAGPADGTEIDGRKSQIVETMSSQCELREGDLAGAGGRCSAPGGYLDLFGAAGRKGLEVEHGGCASVEKEMHVRAVDPNFHDRQNIAAFDGNFFSGRRFLRAEGCRKTKCERREKDREHTGSSSHNLSDAGRLEALLRGICRAERVQVEHQLKLKAGASSSSCRKDLNSHTVLELSHEILRLIGWARNDSRELLHAPKEQSGL